MCACVCASDTIVGATHRLIGRRRRRCDQGADDHCRRADHCVRACVCVCASVCDCLIGLLLLVLATVRRLVELGRRALESDDDEQNFSCGLETSERSRVRADERHLLRAATARNAKGGAERRDERRDEKERERELRNYLLASERVAERKHVSPVSRLAYSPC